MRRRWLAAWGGCAVAGTLLHFGYQWLPNPLTALLAPVNESVWEHLKLLFWPYLGAAWLLTRRQEPRWAAWTGHLAALLAMPAGMLGVYYTLLAGFGVHSLWLDIGLYYLTLAAGFALAHHLSPGAADTRIGRWAPVLLLPVCLWALLLVLFTFAAPSLPIFCD